MDVLKRFEAVCQAFWDPHFYPHSVSRVQRVDTHISAVFLTGSWVYKLKKPVNFEFLDFTSLSARRHFCDREVKLNQRLSQGIYVGVEAVCRDEEGRLSLGGTGQPVEYAVKMRQLPEATSLKKLLVQGKVNLPEMEELGHHLAHFYDESDHNDEIDHYGHAEVVEFNMEENFRQVEPFVSSLIPLENWEFIRQVSRSFFGNYRHVFEGRVAAGRIRDGHGDLRSEHIYFFEGIQVIDCIEFNDRFRHGDVVADLAFLYMDMEHLGYPELGRGMLRGYVEHSADYQLYSLLDFYSAYRAVVKLKVACLHSTEVESSEQRQVLKETAESYLHLAFR
jgi:aminoglycoside phosphotransferase family enzyme